MSILYTNEVSFFRRLALSVEGLSYKSLRFRPRLTDELHSYLCNKPLEAGSRGGAPYQKSLCSIDCFIV